MLPRATNTLTIQCPEVIVIRWTWKNKQYFQFNKKIEEKVSDSDGKLNKNDTRPERSDVNSSNKEYNPNQTVSKQTPKNIKTIQTNN